MRFYEAGALPDVPGDANRDGYVNAADAAVLAAHWLKMGQAVWREGDFNKDRNVDDLDLAILAANWSPGTAGTAVPEPAAILLLLGTVPFVLLYRRRT